VIGRVCPECGSAAEEAKAFNYLDGDLRCVIDGMPLHLYIDTPNENN